MRRATGDRARLVYAPNDAPRSSGREGGLYLAVVIDLHSRRVVGWSMSERMTTDLPLAALHMAYQRHRPPPGLLHSGQRPARGWAHGPTPAS